VHTTHHNQWDLTWSTIEWPLSYYPGGSSRLRFCCLHKRIIARRLRYAKTYAMLSSRSDPKWLLPSPTIGIIGAGSNPGNINYRFGLHGAHLIADNLSSRALIRDQLRNVYRVRNNLVHSNKYPEQAAIASARADAQDLLRRGLLRATYEGFPTPETFAQMLLGRAFHNARYFASNRSNGNPPVMFSLVLTPSIYISDELDKGTPLAMLDNELPVISALRVPYGDDLAEVGNLNTVAGIARITTLPPLGAG
jgi:hypothetical protein